MKADEFIRNAKLMVACEEVKNASYHDVYCVWFNYTLGNMKGLFATPTDNGLYYEVTYDKQKKKLYLDSYAKISNKEYEA